MRSPPRCWTRSPTRCREAAAGRTVRAVVITGAGRGFCSGQDLRAASDDGGLDVGAILRDHYTPAIRAIRSMDQPVIAAVNGVAAGAGFSLALACDLRIAAESATFVQAFVRIGLIPDLASTYFLPRLIGPARAAELAMLGETVDSARALELGIVNRIVPDAELGRRSGRDGRPPRARTSLDRPHQARPRRLARERPRSAAGRRGAPPDGGHDHQRFRRGRERVPREAPGDVHRLVGARGCPRAVDKLTALLGPARVLAGADISEDDWHDESLVAHWHAPDVVVLPHSAAEVVEIIAIAREFAMPVTARGSGTGLAGACVPREGGILIAFREMSFDSRDRCRQPDRGRPAWSKPPRARCSRSAPWVDVSGESR